MPSRAQQVLALRVLEQWCLVGEEPMAGEQWQIMCELAEVDPAIFAVRVTALRENMTDEQRRERLRELGRDRSKAPKGQAFTNGCGPRTTSTNADDLPAFIIPGKQTHTHGAPHHD